MKATFVALLAAAALAATVAVPLGGKDVSRCAEKFEHFKARHKKAYGSSQEGAERMQNFCSSLKEIDEINHRGLTWHAGVNAYSDLTWEEFKSRFLMSSPQNCSATAHTKPISSLVTLSTDPLPTEKDWRNETCGETSCVSMVKNQGMCGSCWTFSTVGALESAHAIKTGTMTGTMFLLSEQQLVDCAQDFNNNGCNGGLPSQAFEYIRYNGGLSKMEDYTYVCGDGHCKPVGGVCRYNPDMKSAIGVKVVVGTLQPISVAFEVVSDLRHYASGVYQSPDCKSTPDMVNHAVLAVGYGTEDGSDYWTIKNSWGFGWGNHGHFKIIRGKNMCAIGECSSFPILDKDE
ncbi:hypothetical protein T484DRAFT_1656154 [Baffinella frigidus]|nr:hypothetical protein T484DRAFT_1656154 [Cryptophyta sp. CCMP2293]